jgi:cobaltochelatase CobN
MIRNYYENNAGSWPQLNAIVIWGTEVLRTEGVSLAEFLYFMGVEPTWDHNGKYKDLKVIPLENLTLKLSDGSIINRPRLDVFTTIVSSNPQWIKMLNDAVKLVYNLNESSTGKNIENYVIKHIDEYIKAYNKTEGALDRVFGLRGAILEGTGVSDLAPSVTNWQDSEEGISNELSSVYMSRISNAWNVNENGKIEVNNNTDQFTYLLSHLTLLTQNLDSTWRVTDSDDYADWFGGLLNAANTLGAKVNTQLLDIRDKNNILSSTLVEEIQKEIRDTLLNPTYIDSQINSASG